MGFGQFKSVGGNSGKPMSAMSDINVTPMVDVMLVLLVIFIIAAPLLNHAVRLDLPSAQAEAIPQNIDTVTLSFDAQGALFWDAELIDLEEIAKRLALLSKQKAPPEILLRADKSTRYELIAQVMAAAQNNGLNKIGFATEAKSMSPAVATKSQPTKSSSQNASNPVKK